MTPSAKNFTVRAVIHVDATGSLAKAMRPSLNCGRCAVQNNGSARQAMFIRQVNMPA